MSLLQEYLAQDSNSTEYGSSHYDQHTDRWVDEGHLPYGHSGHCDVHSDQA